MTEMLDLSDKYLIEAILKMFQWEETKKYFRTEKYNILKFKKLVGWLNSRIEKTEERINELYHRTGEITKSE